MVNDKQNEKRENIGPSWKHPGGKLIELGSEALSDAELLSIIIGTGIKGKSAEAVAKDLLSRFGSYKGLSGQPLEKFLKIKGLGDTKIVRIAATLEIAKRIVDMVIKELKEDEQLRREVFK